MKKTVEIPDALLDEVRRMAERRGVTLRASLEEGLRHVVTSNPRRSRIVLRDASFKGQGLDSHGVCELWTADRDFGRLPGVTADNPLMRRP